MTMQPRVDRDGDDRLERRVPPADPDASVGELVTGVARDTEGMLGKYLELAKLDAREEIARARHAALAIGVGAAVLAVGALLLAFAAAQLLAFVIPLAAGYAIVGGVLALAGGLWLSRDRSEQLRFQIKALDEAKQDLRWINENR